MIWTTFILLFSRITMHIEEDCDTKDEDVIESTEKPPYYRN